MAKITFDADQEAEATGDQGGGGFKKKLRGIYNLQITTASNGEKTSAQAKTPGVPITKFVLEVADDDERDMLGEKVWHNVTWTPRGKDEKAPRGHGMAVHWLHATNMTFNGKFDFDEDDFLQQEHAMVQALLEVEEFESKTVNPKTGKGYVNEKFVIRQVYTDAHPAPAELPPEPAKKAPQAAGGGRAAPTREESIEEVPF